MTATLNGLEIRRVLGRVLWSAPEPFGPDGWTFVSERRRMSVIVTVAEHWGEEWVHASIAGLVLPTYEDLVLLHQAVWRGKGYAYQVFAPVDQHVNIHEHALHLWGRVDGKPMLPEFAGPLGDYERSI